MQADTSVPISFRIIAQSICKQEKSNANCSRCSQNLPQPTKRCAKRGSFFDAPRYACNRERNSADRDATLNRLLALLLVLKNVQRNLVAQHWKKLAVHIELISNTVQLDRASSV